MSDSDLLLLSNLTYDKSIEMKRAEVIFPNDSDFGPNDWSSQRMFDYEGMEERKLWCISDEK